MPVTTLAVLGDATLLVGNVKLSPGTGITLTRVDADNAIRIDGAVAGPLTAYSNDKYVASFYRPPQYVRTPA